MVKSLPIGQKAMLATLLLAVILANIAQPYPDLAPLQHIPTVALILAAPVLIRRWRLSTHSVASIWLFFVLHTLGGRYIYSYVPYDEWSRSITGGTVSGAFGWTRNQYDRLIHFSFGLLWTLPVRQGMVRRHGMGEGVALFTAFAVIGLTSALYEMFEWGLTVVAAGDTADYYNGQQGDIWDAQKDMALAQAGSVVTIIWTRVRRARRWRGA